MVAARDGVDDAGGIRVRGLDGLRAWAAGAVLVGHSWFNSGMAPLDRGPLLSLVAASSSGVDVFFVLSGFVVFASFLREDGHRFSLYAYARRRGARMLPAYWTALGFALFASRVAAEPFVGWPATAVGPLDLVTNVLFLQVLVAGLGLSVGLVAAGTTWTLCHEIAFYALLPLVAGWFRRHPVVGVALGVGVSLAWRSFVIAVAGRGELGAGAGDLAVRMATQFPTYVGHFALGMGAAIAAATIRRGMPSRRAIARLGSWLTAVGAVALITGVWLAGERAVAGSGGEAGRFLDALPTALAASALVLGLAVHGGAVGAVADNALAAWIGDRSYGIYLFHFPVIVVLRATVVPGDGSLAAFAVLSLLTLLVTVPLAAVSYRFVEQPAIAWSRPGLPGTRPALERDPLPMTPARPGTGA